MLNIKKNASIFGFIIVFFAIFFGFSWGGRQLIKEFEQTNNIYYLIAGAFVIAILIKLNLFMMW
jgi:hypothetical protein